MYVCVYVCMCIYMYVCMYVCMYAAERVRMISEKALREKLEMV